MRTARITLAFLLTLSLAMLPMAGAFAASSDGPTASDVVDSAYECCDDETTTSDHVVASHDCCDPGSMPADHVMSGCQASAGCTAKCFSIVAMVFSDVAIPPPIGGTESPFVSNPFHSLTASPPYRPPRV